MTGQPTAHLWEFDHPYYCQEGNYFKTGQHTRFASWTDFVENTVFVTADRDQNLLSGEEYLLLFFVLQRKALLCSVEMPVSEADETAVRAFLEDCATTMRATWEPLLGTLEAAA